MRGYGGTDRPEAIDAYAIDVLALDVVGLIDACDAEQAVLVGHDWGAAVVWGTSLRHPERVRAVVNMSVPYRPRGSVPPTQAMKQLVGEHFFYQLYFQEPGPADRELGADPRRFLRTMLWSISGDGLPDAFAPLLPREGTGFLDQLSEPPSLPSWLTEEDLDVYAEAFERTGFTGGLNYYRNFDRNWERSAGLEHATIDAPTLFIAGTKDPVLAFVSPDGMERWVPDLRTHMVEGAGHWVQQERPDEVNAAMLGFLSGL
jgi:pimeloyl-ACP methyl ester carboxylesterase